MSRVINVERVKDSKAEDTLRRALIALEDNDFDISVEIDGLVCISTGDFGASGASMLRGIISRVEKDAEDTELNLLINIGKDVICFDSAGLEAFDRRLNAGLYEITHGIIGSKPYKDTLERLKIRDLRNRI